MRPLGLNMGERLGATPEGICALGMRSKACSRTKYWSTPYSKLRPMKESPYREMERSESSRGMPLSSISSGMVTRRSISSGAWPGHWVMSKSLLADEVLVNSILEVQGDEGESVPGNGAKRIEPGNAVELNFERNGDQTLEFFGGMAGPLGDELDVRRREIGIGVDGEFLKRPCAPHHQGDGRHNNQERLSECEGNESGDHGVSLIGYWWRIARREIGRASCR